MNGNELQQSRRSFIKTAGVVIAGAAAAGMAGCAPQKMASTNSSAATLDEIQWDEEFDAIVIGGGVAGQSAAITIATEGNGESVLLLEKGPQPSGNSPFALGVGIWTDDREKFRAYFSNMQGDYNRIPEDVIDAYVDGVMENKDWLESIGAADNYLWVTECGAPTADGVGGEYPELGGGDSIGWLGVGMAEDAPKDADHICMWMWNSKLHGDLADKIDTRTNMPVTALVQDPDTKTIVGVIAGEGSDETYIKANKGVVMALGGFESNPEMMQDYLDCGAGVPGAGQMNTGDGITMCYKINADMWHMNSVAGFWMFGRDLEDTASTCNILQKYPSPKEFGITVGTNGRRFYQDWDGYMCNPGYELNPDYNNVEEGRKLMRTHVGSRHGHMQFGGEWPHLPMPEKGWFIFDQNGLMHNDEGLGGALGANVDPSDTETVAKLAYKADTIEELAGMIDVPTEELVKTVERWNRYVAEGEDEAFYRPAEFMHPLDTPPFYAQLVRPHFLNTDGGPKRSAKGEVLDTDGQPIPGLYAAGEFGSVWSHYYQGAGNIAECMIFGRICARSIIEK